MASDGHHCACCTHSMATPSVHQTLDEMEFERGIWSAALDEDLKRVKSFLQKGTDPNLRDQAGYTALHYASRSGNEEVCRLLLDGGACANPQTRAGLPLCTAPPIVGMWPWSDSCWTGADPMLCDDDGSSPLHKAAKQGHEEVCDLLLQRCPALRTLTDKRSRAPYHMAGDNGPLHEMLKLPEDTQTVRPG